MVDQLDGKRGFAQATTEGDVKNLCSSLSKTSLEEVEVRIGEKRTIRGKPASWVLWEIRNRKVLKMGREKDGWEFSP